MKGSDHQVSEPWGELHNWPSLQPGEGFQVMVEEEETQAQTSEWGDRTGR